MSNLPLNFDLDGDGVSDVIVQDTNGHTVYVNLQWVVRKAVVAASALVAFAVTLRYSL